MNKQPSITITDPRNLCDRLESAVMNKAPHNGKTGILRTEIGQTAQDWLIKWVGDVIEKAANRCSGRVREICREVNIGVASLGPSVIVFDSDASSVAAEFGGYKISRPFAVTLEKLADACWYESASDLMVDLLETYLNFLDEDPHQFPPLPGIRFADLLEARAASSQGAQTER